MRAILVVNPKGGSGKTTVSTNLAGYLARAGEQVTLWDLDRQKSSLEWLDLRPASLPVINRLDAGRVEEQSVIPADRGWLILDSPAGMQGQNLARALRLADRVIVPVQPSVFDMAATRDFLDQLITEKVVRKPDSVGIIGMRVDVRTRAAATLQKFLEQYDMPLLTCLRDTVNYTNAAFNGKTIFDLPPHQAGRDLEQWQPVTEWVQRM